MPDVRHAWWTTKEDDVMRLYYPQMGSVWVAKKINRTMSAVQSRARHLKLKAGPAVHSLVQRKRQDNWRASNPAPARFDAQYMPITETGCWIWMGYVGDHGYSLFSYGGRKHVAAQWSYEHYRGSVNKKLFRICGERLCVNPWHMTTREDYLRREARLHEMR